MIGPNTVGQQDGVRCIQQALGITDDGQYGQATYTAVKEFQHDSGLSVDGTVGPETGDLLAPRAPDGCFAVIPTTSSVQDWVDTPGPGAPDESGDVGGSLQAPTENSDTWCLASTSSPCPPREGHDNPDAPGEPKDGVETYQQWKESASGGGDIVTGGGRLPTELPIEPLIP